MIEFKTKFTDGSVAELVGRFNFEDDSDNEPRYLYIYTIDEDKPYESEKDDLQVLTPTANFAHCINSKTFDEYWNEGKRSILLSRDVWDKVIEADDVHHLNDSQDGWINYKKEYVEDFGEIVDDLDAPTEPVTADAPTEPVTFDHKTKATNMKEKGDEKMDSKSAFTKTLDMGARSAKQAAKTVAAQQVNTAMVKGLQKGLRMTGMSEELVENETLEMVAQGMLPILLAFLLNTEQGRGMMNKMLGDSASDYLLEGCELAMQSNAEELIGPAFEMLKTVAKPALKEMMEAVKNGGLHKVGDEEIDIDIEEVEEVIEQKVRA